MQATECANPSCTVAAGCVRVRMQSNQFAMCSRLRSSIPMGGSLLSPGKKTYFDSRFWVNVGVVFVRTFLFDQLIPRAAFAADVN